MAEIKRRRDGVWLVRVFLGRDQRGKTRYLNKTVHGSRKDAQSYANEIERRRDIGTLIEPGRMELNTYLDEWLENAAKPKVSERSYADYRDLLKRYVRDPLGHYRLDQLTPLAIQRLYTSMLERGLSARTVRYTHTVLSAALKQAVRWRILPQNPAEYVELPHTTHREMRALSQEEATRFLNGAKTDRFGLLFAFAMATGMRPEEYLGLKWSDVDLKAGTVRVQRVLRRSRDNWQSWTLAEPKTPKSRRTIPLPNTITVELSHHKARQAEERFQAGGTWHDHGLVFAAPNGMPLNLELVTQHFKSILKKAGLPTSIRLYDLRHTCATLLLMAGEHPKVVAERLGHATVTMTLDVYSHVLPTMQKAATDKLEAMLFHQQQGKPGA